VPGEVLAALITALGAVTVAVISLVRHERNESRAQATEAVEERLSHDEVLFAAFERRIEASHADLDWERSDKDRIRRERDAIRLERDAALARARVAERKVDEWLAERERRK
jgi:hypothetical protein